MERGEKVKLEIRLNDFRDILSEQKKTMAMEMRYSGCDSLAEAYDEIEHYACNYHEARMLEIQLAESE